MERDYAVRQQPQDKTSGEEQRLLTSLSGLCCFSYLTCAFGMLGQWASPNKHIGWWSKSTLNVTCHFTGTQLHVQVHKEQKEVCGKKLEDSTYLIWSVHCLQCTLIASQTTRVLGKCHHNYTTDKRLCLKQRTDQNYKLLYRLNGKSEFSKYRSSHHAPRYRC